MRDFVEALDDRLRLAAAPRQATRGGLSLVPPPSTATGALVTRRRPARRLRRRSLAMGGGAALALSVAGAITLPAGSDGTGLPILATATSEASALRSNPSIAQSGVDLRRAHPFPTPGGRGWVLFAGDHSTVCIAAPDADLPGTFGSTCTSRMQAERRGLLLQVIGDRRVNPRARNAVSFLLPVGAHHLVLETPSGTSRPTPRAGVVTMSLAGQGVLSYRVGEAIHTARFDGPFRSDEDPLCDGRVVDTDPRASVAETLALVRRAGC